MEQTTLGKTGLRVSRLGIGLSEIGSSDESNVKKILSTALDAGINFFDTASCYGRSEEFIGKTMSSMRDNFVLASKCGHSSRFNENFKDWGYKGIKASIDRSLRLLKTDRLDLIQVHSCDLQELEKGEIMKALEESKSEGKVLHLGYSGDNDAAVWAAESGFFETIQTSFNLVEQKARYKLFDVTRNNGLGVIAKRPIANGAWRALEKPNVSSAPSDYAAEYYKRAQILGEIGPLHEEPEDRILTSMGFIFSFDEVDVAIIGTQNRHHLQSNIEMYNNSLPISKSTVDDLCSRFDSLGNEWNQRT